MIRPYFARPASGLVGPSQWRPGSGLAGNWYYYDAESRQMYGLSAENKGLSLLAVAGIALSGAYLIVRLTDKKRKK